MRLTCFVASLTILAATSLIAHGQTEDSQESSTQDLRLKDFRPRPMLKNIKRTDLRRAKFPVVDFHTHLDIKWRRGGASLDDFVATMNKHNIAVCVSLDAKLGATTEDHTSYLWDKYRNRFAVFVHLDWQGNGSEDDPKTWDCNRPDFPRRIARQLADAKSLGISGVKFFKGFGLRYKNPDGSLIKIDDERWDPIWKACGNLDLPVITHTGDPAAFFQPIDKFNERYEELARRPHYSFYGNQYPSRDELLAARNRVIERHPNTTFIGAHLAGNSEDLKTVGQWLDKFPNLYVEPASRIAELGRQPNTSREFFIKYQDRILFGTDGPWPELRLSYYWRFFETRDEYFPYSEKQPPPQGFWMIYGIELPDNVLQKLYFENAFQVIPGLQTKFEKAVAELSR